VRLARDFGTVSELYPEGVDDLTDLPHGLFELVRHAMVVLSFDELPEDERPAKRIWLDPKKLKDHFAWVRRKREREMKGDRSDDVDDTVENEAAKGLIVGG
jgi:hypothetical protein